VFAQAGAGVAVGLFEGLILGLMVFAPISTLFNLPTKKRKEHTAKEIWGDDLNMFDT